MVQGTGEVASAAPALGGEMSSSELFVKGEMHSGGNGGMSVQKGRVTGATAEAGGLSQTGGGVARGTVAVTEAAVLQRRQALGVVGAFSPFLASRSERRSRLACNAVDVRAVGGCGGGAVEARAELGRVCTFVKVCVADGDRRQAAQEAGGMASGAAATAGAGRFDGLPRTDVAIAVPVDTDSPATASAAPLLEKFVTLGIGQGDGVPLASYPILNLSQEVLDDEGCDGAWSTAPASAQPAVAIAPALEPARGNNLKCPYRVADVAAAWACTLAYERGRFSRVGGQMSCAPAPVRFPGPSCLWIMCTASCSTTALQ
jgi:hypothetical protein